MYLLSRLATAIFQGVVSGVDIQLEPQDQMGQFHIQWPC